MREITLYTVDAQRMLASGDTYELMTRVGPNAFSLCELPSGDFATPIDRSFKAERLPIHHIRRCQRIIDKRAADGYALRAEETYIAIHPELQEILLAQFEPERAQLRKQIGDMQSHAAWQAGEIERMRGQRAAFNSLPWYRRVLMVLRGAV